MASNNIKQDFSGLCATELFESGVGLTYEDFTILDTNLTDINRDDISLETNLGKGVILKTPIIAAPMDTVTNASVCVAIALEGGIGVVHYNYKRQDGTPDIAKQIKDIEDVKRYENGFIEHPITVSPENTIAQAIDIGQNMKVDNSIIDTFPVTEGGKPHGKIVGLLRKQDYSRTKHTEAKVKERMLPLEKLIMAQWPVTLDEANDFLWEKHLLYLPVSDNHGNLKYLVTMKDLDKNEEFPLATKDDKKSLRVLFAVETRPEFAYTRLEAGFAAGADGCVIDTSQGYTGYELDMINYILTHYPDKLVIGGNISTREAYIELDRAGLDAYRCGQGPGSICTTAGAIGVSRAGAASVYDCANVNGNMKTIADGGIRQVGDILKAISIGAHAVMLGNMLAGTEESPGDTIIDPESGLPVKLYRGMGSKEANTGGIRGYSKLPQGVSGNVQYKGSIHQWVPLIRDGLLSGMHALNCLNLDELHSKMRNNILRYERRTIGGMRESSVHDLK
jgi:IMP dehydrogenase